MQNKSEHNKDNLSEVAPILTSLKTQNNFQTPDNYFNELPLIMSDEIKSESSSFWAKFKLSVIIPSLTIALLGWFVFNSARSNDISLNINSDEFYSELISDEEGIDIAILFDEPTTSFNDFTYIENEEFNFELPIEIDDLDLNIMFN